MPKPIYTFYMKTQLIHAIADLRITMQKYNFFMNPQEHSQKHHVINGQIGNPLFGEDVTIIGKDVCLFHIVVLHRDKGRERTMDSVILARLHLDWHDRQQHIAFHKEIHLTMLLAVVIIQTMPVGV